MAITRLPVEAEVVSEVGPLLVLAKKAATATGSNPDLNGPIAFALQALGVTPADPTSVVDADFATFDNAQYPTLCQVIEYYAIKKCLSSIVMPNEMAQDRRQDWNEMVRRFESMRDSLQRQHAGLLQVQRNPTVSGVLETRYPTPMEPSRFALGHGRIDH